MESLRNPDFVKRYEDVVFDLETSFTLPANNVRQKKGEYKFVADNTGEVAPFDWHNARIIVNFKVNKKADGTAIAAKDKNGIVNGAHSLIRKLKFEANGLSIYECEPCNQAVNIKNLLDYTRQFAEDMGTNQFFFLDTGNGAHDSATTVEGYNNGLVKRKSLLLANNEVNVEIPLNPYSFFEELDNELLLNMKVGIIFNFESDANLIWQNADDCRVVVTKMQLFLPRIIFTAEGNKMYMERYMKPHKWNYLREEIYSSNSSKQKPGTFKIASAIEKPRDVFVWILNDEKKDNQEKNPFLFDTFSVSSDERTLESCQLQVGNGNKYPENEYAPNTQMSRVFRDVHKYSYTENEYQGGGTLLNRGNFGSLFPFIYFDLRNQKVRHKRWSNQINIQLQVEWSSS